MDQQDDLRPAGEVASGEVAHELADPGARQRLVLPIGLLIGMSADGSSEVRCGVDIHSLTAEQHAVWALAHGSAGAVRAGRRWDRDALVHLADALDVAAVGATLDSLAAMGLVVETLDHDTEAEHFARTHRAVPLTAGTGNTPEDPSLFGIGSGGEPVIRLGFSEYDLWHWSAMDDTLWQACQGAAAAAARARPDTDTDTDDGKLASVVPADVDTGRSLTRFLQALPGLLLTGTTYLDVAFRLGRPGTGATGSRRATDAA